MTQKFPEKLIKKSGIQYCRAIFNFLPTIFNFLRFCFLFPFCTVSFVLFKNFGVHQLQPQTHLVLLLYFDSTVELPHLHTIRNSMKSACCS